MAFSAPNMCFICGINDMRRVALSGHSMLCTCINHHNGSSYTNSSRLKKWHFLDLVCSIHVVTITTWLSYSNRKCLKKRHFLNLICAVLNLNLKKHLVCNQVHSTQIDGKLCKITALARCPISHSQLYLMGHKVLQ